MRTVLACVLATLAAAITFAILFFTLASGHVYGPWAIAIEAVIALLAAVGVYRTIAAKPYRGKFEEQAK